MKYLITPNIIENHRLLTPARMLKVAGDYNQAKIGQCVESLPVSVKEFALTIHIPPHIPPLDPDGFWANPNAFRSALMETRAWREIRGLLIGGTENDEADWLDAETVLAAANHPDAPISLGDMRSRGKVAILWERIG